MASLASCIHAAAFSSRGKKKENCVCRIGVLPLHITSLVEKNRRGSLYGSFNHHPGFPLTRALLPANAVRSALQFWRALSLRLEQQHSPHNLVDETLHTIRGRLYVRLGDTLWRAQTPLIYSKCFPEIFILFCRRLLFLAFGTSLFSPATAPVFFSSSFLLVHLAPYLQRMGEGRHCMPFSFSERTPMHAVSAEQERFWCTLTIAIVPHHPPLFLCVYDCPLYCCFCLYLPMCVRRVEVNTSARTRTL